MSKIQGINMKNEFRANKTVELKEFGQVLQQILLSSAEDFTYERIVNELRGDHNIDIEDVLQQFDCESFELLLETETLQEFVEYAYSLEAGEFLFRGKCLANMSNIRKEIFESEMNKRIKDMDNKIHWYTKNLNELQDNFERIQARKDAQHAQEISKLRAQLEKERNERINLAKQFAEFKKEMETRFNKNEVKGFCYLKFPFKNATVSNVSTNVLNNDLLGSTTNDIVLTGQLGEKSPHLRYELINNENWLANRWDPNACGQMVRLSSKGLVIKREFIDFDSHDFYSKGYVRTIRGCEFQFQAPPTRGAQICYFEMKHIKGGFDYGFCAKEYNPNNPKSSKRIFTLSSNGLYSDGNVVHSLPKTLEYEDLISCYKSAVIGCGILECLDRRKIFYTLNGQLLAKPIRLPSSAPIELFPFVDLRSESCRFVNTNFGKLPFIFKYEDNLDELSQEMIV